MDQRDIRIHDLPQLETALPFDGTERILRKIKARMGDGDETGLRLMFELLVAALLANLKPSIGLQGLYDLSTVHNVCINTHSREISTVIEL
jgi:hypothetical protein